MLIFITIVALILLVYIRLLKELLLHAKEKV